MTTLFTADLHLGHANIIEYCPGRPGPGPEEMTAELIERWNSAVGPDDTVWFLGDVALGRIAETLPLVGLLNGTKHLVAGNHDRCWSGHKKTGQWTERYIEAGFVDIAEQTTIELGGRSVLLCHFPYSGDSHDTDRYVAHRPVDTGGWLLHGHVHDAWRVNGRQINVGTDVWDYAPVSAEVLVELMDSAG